MTFDLFNASLLKNVLIYKNKKNTTFWTVVYILTTTIQNAICLTSEDSTIQNMSLAFANFTVVDLQAEAGGEKDSMYRLV